MRPVVFGPSPLVEAALGVFKGQALGREREAAAQDRADELAKRERGAQLDALTIAQRTLANDEATNAVRQRKVREARVQADAERLRASPFNADGKYGQPGEPVDVEHDYAADLEKETRIGALKQALVAGGMPEADAEARARWNVDKEALAAEATTRRQAREKQAAEIARVKAQTALDAARAVVERTAGGTAGKTRQDTRDKARIAGWTIATIRAGETDTNRLTAAARAMNPGVDPQVVAGAVADAQLQLEAAKNKSGGLPPLPDDSTPGATPPAPTPSAPDLTDTTPADRWEELVAGGMDKAAATAQVQREFRLR